MFWNIDIRCHSLSKQLDKEENVNRWKNTLAYSKYE
jgi:hypothetical protein